MAKFETSLSALGYFWPQGKPEKKLPGRVFMDAFPKLRVYRMGADAASPVGPNRRQIFHGITDENESVTIFDGIAYWADISFNNHTGVENIGVTGNYMLVGSTHFDKPPNVNRLSFSSAITEHVLRLFANPDYSDIRYRRDGTPILHKQVCSHFDLKKNIRVRAFRSRVPNPSIKPMSFFVIDFRDLTTINDARVFFHKFRDFLAMICGASIDVWDVQLRHGKGQPNATSRLYFPDFVARPVSSSGFPMQPLLNICQDRLLFRKVISSWLVEATRRSMARGAFASIQDDEGTLRLSHLRELVTIVEMLQGRSGASPIPNRRTAALLRDALLERLDAFARDEPGAQEWREAITKRIQNINYHDAKTKVRAFFAALPEGIISVPDNFARDVIDLRNKLVHDISQLKPPDYSSLAFFVAKIKAAYVINDAMALGAKVDAIGTRSTFIHHAENITTNFFDDDAGDTDAPRPAGEAAEDPNH